MYTTTNLNDVKNTAIALLMVDIAKTDFSPFIVQHPFTSTGIVTISQHNNEPQIFDITQSPENLRIWQDSMRIRILKAESAFEIYMMVNKPYALAFLRYTAEYLSQKDFSEILASAWIQSENPNNDVNVSRNDLLSMFKKADPASLMIESERTELERLDNVVTIYRGISTDKTKNIYALSWTLGYDTAAWFAQRYNKDGSIYKAQIEKKYILALFNGRNESEIIVEPRFLMNITEYELQTNHFSQTM